MAEENITWDDAISSGNYVRFKKIDGSTEYENKVLTVTNWKLEEVDKFGEKQIELSMDVLKEDGNDVEKMFTTVSNRLKSKLRPILENRPVSDIVTVDILPVGEAFNRIYSVKEVKPEAVVAADNPPTTELIGGQTTPTTE